VREVAGHEARRVTRDGDLEERFVIAVGQEDRERIRRHLDSLRGEEVEERLDGTRQEGDLGRASTAAYSRRIRASTQSVSVPDTTMRRTSAGAP
jgi:hypothetical protein